MGYLNQMLDDKDLPRQLVKETPQLLTLSLLELIIPRLQFCRGRGLWPLDDVSHVLTISSADFLDFVGASEKQFHQYIRTMDMKSLAKG